jgi:sugar phosphate isomerase/epimerase
MQRVGRRSFLRGAAGLLPISSIAGKAAGGDHLNNIGVQLYTVRNKISDHAAEVLNAIQGEGYTEIEATYSTLPTIWPALEKTKLKPVSVHIDSAIFDNHAETKKALDEAAKRGFQYAVCPYVPEEKRNGIEDMKSLAATLNQAGARSKKAGLHLCYHNHAFEFEPLQGTMPIEVLLKETDKNLVWLELDVFWASVAGHDPSQFIQEHAGRIVLVHLKDKKKGFPVQYNEHVPKDAFKEVGSGSIDFPAVLRAATAQGAKHFFVEQDETPGDPIESLGISYKYLHNLTF